MERNRQKRDNCRQRHFKNRNQNTERKERERTVHRLQVWHVANSSGIHNFVFCADFPLHHPLCAPFHISQPITTTCGTPSVTPLPPRGTFRFVRIPILVRRCLEIWRKCSVNKYYVSTFSLSVWLFRTFYVKK